VMLYAVFWCTLALGCKFVHAEKPWFYENLAACQARAAALYQARSHEPHVTITQGETYKCKKQLDGTWQDVD
jgi:hypothetical protein